MFKTFQIEEFTLVQSTLLNEGLKHCFTTKLSTGSLSFDTTHQKNREKLCQLLRLKTSQLFIPKQEHTDQILTLSEPVQTNEPCDAVITQVKGLPIMIQTADCLPIIVYAKESRAVGLIHAGWRGTTQQIAFKTVQKMIRDFNTPHQELYAVIGPSIGLCCFETNRQTKETFEKSWEYTTPFKNFVQQTGPETYKIDLKGINNLQLLSAGVKCVNISSDCTCCLSDAVYHSYRGNNQTHLRNMTLVQLL